MLNEHNLESWLNDRRQFLLAEAERYQLIKIAAAGRPSFAYYLRYWGRLLKTWSGGDWVVGRNRRLHQLLGLQIEGKHHADGSVEPFGLPGKDRL